MPRLRILAGPAPDKLKEIQANTGEGVDVSSGLFEGNIAVYIKGFVDPSGTVQDSAYFDDEKRTGVTWSIQSQGRFLKTYNANDILFGNIFDHPLPIPWGFSTILGFMHYIDPTLEQDLQSQTKPWALSPLISTMPHFAHMRVEELHKAGAFPPIRPLDDDTSELVFSDGKRPNELPEGSAEARRAFFKTADHRKLATLGPEDLVTTDFCYNYLTFSPTGVHLSIPGGFSLDMMRLWDGRPVNFVCCARKQADESSNSAPLGDIFWCVTIEILQDEENDEEDEESGDDRDPAGESAADDVD